MRLRGFTSALSMRTEWIVILTVYAVVLPILTGWAAFRVTRQTIENDTRARLEASTKSVREAVDTGVEHNQDQLKDVVRLVDTGCAVSGVMNTDCVHDELEALVKSGASTATLRFAKRKGKWTVISEGPDVVAECPTQTCVWRDQERKKTYYTLSIQEDTHSGMVLSVAWPLEPLLKTGLDTSNSAALVEVEPTRWEVIGRSDALTLVPMGELEHCADWRSKVFSSVDSTSYRVLAPMPAVPGVCVASLRSIVDRVEAG